MARSGFRKKDPVSSSSLASCIRVFGKGDVSQIMPPPQVSLIITSYNQQEYLREAIESAIDQTVAAFEIIVADDHSTKDGSIETIREYAARYPGLVRGLFQEKNVGIPKNRNSALRMVKRGLCRDLGRRRPSIAGIHRAPWRCSDREPASARQLQQSLRY